MKKKKRRFGQIRQPIHIDIGMVIFFIILVYILFSLISYITSKKTEVYEVRMGTLSENAFYRGIALREETIVNSRYTGNVNYYNREGDKVRAGGLAYSVDESGEIEDYADSDMLAGEYFTDKDIDTFRKQAVRFVEGFDPGRFYTVYDFKGSTSSQAQKISNRAILSGIKDLDSTSIHTVKAKKNGSIVYSYDNYNGKTFEELTPEDFDSSACRKTKLENGQKIQEGRPVYRLITDENWSVAILTDSKEAANRLDGQDVRVRFLKNNYVSAAHAEKDPDNEDSSIINLKFSNSVEAFCNDRFVDIEILTSEERGLKVPKTSITYGDFFLVPKEYVIEGSNGKQGVLLRVYTANQGQGTRFIPAVPYSETEDEYYLDNSVLRDGEILERPNSTDQFTLGKKESLTGVYYINKGYPDFRQVEIQMENSEYAIVSSNQLYGLQEYDYIVLHADTIRFNNY